MNSEDYEFNGTLAFSNEELKKELHQIALNGLKAFVDAYESVYLSSTTSVNNSLILVEEDLNGFSHITLGASLTDAKEAGDLATTMVDALKAAKSLYELETQNDINTIDLISGITTSIASFKKIVNDIGDTFDVTSKNAGIITSAIGFTGAFVATFDGTSKKEKYELLENGVDLILEAGKLALKVAFPAQALIIDVGVCAVELLNGVICSAIKNLDNESEYRKGLVDVYSEMDTLMDKYNIPKFTPDDDDVYNRQSDIFMNALTGNDTVKNDGTKVTIYGNYGDDSISNGADKVSINGGSGSDTIYSTGRVESTFTNGKSKYYYHFISNVMIDGSAGDDYISSNSKNSKLYGGLGNDSIYNYGDNTTIDSGDGNDYINNFVECYQTSYYHYSGGDGVSIYAGKGDDKIFNTGYLVTINGGIGNDFISNGEKATVYGDDGNDTISNGASLSVLYGGMGEDSIYNDAVNVTINGGEDNDHIENEAVNVLVDGGDGADIIINEAANVTIRGGKGDDDIQNKSYKSKNYDGVVYLYESGDGNDKIWGYNGNDTLQISNFRGAYFASGGHIIVSVESGSILLSHYTADTINVNGSIINVNRIINGTGESDYLTNYVPDVPDVTINGFNGNDTIVNGGERSIVVAGKGNDYISNSGVRSTILGGDNLDTIDNYASLAVIDGENDDDSIVNRVTDVTINGGSGGDYIRNFYQGHNTYIDGGQGSDSIYNGNSSNVTINGGADNDTIENLYGANAEIYGGDGDDCIHSESSNNTINGGIGNDYIKLDTFDSKNIFLIYSNGDGDDTVYGFMYDDTLKIVGSSYTTLESGDDVIVSVGNGSIKLIGNRNRKLNIQGKLSDDTVTTVETSKNISNTVSNTIISGTKYADTISNSASRVTIDGGDNNDSITSVGDKVSISSGNGNDTVYSDVAGSIESGENVTLDGGMGEDYISNDSSYSRLEGKDGNDTIINYGWNTSIYGGTGNDVINNFNAFAGEGNNVLISGGAGKDSLTSTGQNDSIYGDEGNDTIYGWNSNILVDGGADNDYIYVGNYETNTSIYGGAGDDTIANFNSKSYIGGGKGNDLIYNDNQQNNVFLYESGDGNDTIYGYSANDAVKITGGKYSSVKSGNDLKISVGTGSILLKDVANTTINIIGTLKGGNLDTDTLPTGITIKNSVLTAANKFTGNKIDVANYDGVTKVNASNVIQGISIVGGSDNDSLKGGKDADTVAGGKGKNTLTGGNGADIFVYSGGDDLIIDYKTGEDKIKLNPSAITSSTVKGSDIILTTAEGTISIKSAKDKVITFVDDSGNKTEKIFYGNMSYEPLDIGLTYDTKRVVLTANNKFSGNKIDLSDYLPTVEKVNVSALSTGINVEGNTANNSVKGSAGADTISGGAGKDTILGGKGNDIISGGADNDILKGDDGNDTLNGGTGNNTLTGGAGNDIFIYDDGNDVITDYFTGQNIIKLVSGTIMSASVKSSDVVLNISTGSIIVKNGKGKKITVDDFYGNTTTEYYGLMNYNPDKTALTLSSAFSTSLKSADYATTVKKIDASAVSKSINVIGNSQNNTIIGSGKAETIYGGSGNDSIMGNAGNDKLFGDTGADTLSGGKGNDTLTGGEGNDAFFYANGDGNDVIADFTVGQDSIYLTSGTVSNASLKSSDMVFKIGSGALTVKNAKNKEISIGNSVYYNNLVYDTSKTSVTLGSGFSGSLKSSDYASTIKTINASGLTKSTNIVGNSQNNTIIGSSKAETIYGDSGNDSIIGNAGNDKLYGDAGNDTLIGGDGNDSLYGGNGNNTLTGGKGKDIFAYEGGNDTITDYTADQDTIKITTGIITKTSYSGNNVIFTVDSGSITVLDAKGKKISITDSNKKTTTLTYNQDVSYTATKTSSNARWFTADDNNFITNEFNLDSVADISDTNYSVGQIEYVENNVEFTMGDSLVSASTFNDK